MKFPLFPFLINIQDREILIVGGGQVAARRADTLLRCGAKVTAVSPCFIEKFPREAVKICREFIISDISRKFLFVIAASDKREINRLVHDTAKNFNIPVNIADCQSECDFYFPSLINCENISVSVSSAGESSKLTRKLSDRLRKIWPLWVNDERNFL
ncbi:MAG: NAD(P)-dependent oxidoreductase [Synergistaceae bacterium]|nr:NAD(P)-dependent oxidoreductase [Synergistaceae bacterium]